jgi:heterodisulfide reductase subunit C
MAVLKQVAAELRPPKYRPFRLFYTDFLQGVRRNGRTQEMMFMAMYFTHMADIRLPVRYAGLGMTLMAKGKISLPWPGKTRRSLKALFDKVAEIENETIPVLSRMLP